MALKPVVFVQGKYGYNAQNTTQQVLLLKAMQITQDPKRLREMIGVKAVADVYRTLDKIAMRKEYHSQLSKHGLTFDYIAKHLKDTIDGAEKDKDRLSGLSMLMKSIGMDKYDETATGGGGWEDVLLKINGKVPAGETVLPKAPEYEVIVPTMPEDVRLAKEKSNNEARGLYE